MGDDPHFRRTARRPLELTVRFRKDAPDAPLETHGRLVDLGIGGAQIACERLPLAETQLRVELTAPTAWEPLDLRAIVRWVDTAASTFGVAFPTLKGNEATALYQLVAMNRFEASAEPDTGPADDAKPADDAPADEVESP
ncbi:MAG: PilZ domain-containing protein [Sandaracinaceae bacterium]